MNLAAAALLFIAQIGQDSWDGRGERLRVTIPRIDTAAVVDGRLDEAVWARAARLTGFSQYQPVDGRPADEPTEVLVWYAADAIWFGIRARELHGDVVRATRANRDNIGSDDYVQILLDTYNDRRNAFVFGVNPLGVQQDGTRSDQSGGGAGGRSATGGGMRDMNPMDGNVDLNPDFAFESRGRLVDGGYEVEVRIPFKTLRYQDGSVQDWGIHLLRRVQHSGAQDSWAPVVRASASFLSQAGVLVGLTGLRRGVVFEAIPTVTARADGSQGATAWDYQSDADASVDVRWGIRQNLTLNGTINPDFSQVEADVGQVALNERFALFYPEKRPFFLDGLELFDTPNRMIYTRRIVAPDAGVKLGGKLGGTNVALLLAADDESTSSDGSTTPLFAATRIRRDLGTQSTLGGVITTREEGANSSRLAGADVRIVHSGLYYAQFQAVGSWAKLQGERTSGSYLEAEWDRTGRAWGFHYTAKAVGPNFEAATGFVERTGIVEGMASNRFTVYGEPGSLLQTASAFVSAGRILDYDRPRAAPIEGSESIRPSATLRGGWRLSGSIARNFYVLDPANYAAYTVTAPSGTLPFGTPGETGSLYSASLGATTPTYRLLTASLTVSNGETAIFSEATLGRRTRIDASVDLRPTASLRTSAQYVHQVLDRKRDGSRFSREGIPRVKVEYQLTRAIFVRAVAQYMSRLRSPLLDAQGRPIGVDGTTDAGESLNELQADWLFSYRPTPGTLFYFGYGATMTEDERFRFQDLRRGRDGFFAKASYLWRL